MTNLIVLGNHHAPETVASPSKCGTRQVSPREMEAIEVLVVCGPKVKNAEIAWQMNCSEPTVRAFLRTAAMKLGCAGPGSRYRLVAWYQAAQGEMEKAA